MSKPGQQAFFRLQHRTIAAWAVCLALLAILGGAFLQLRQLGAQLDALTSRVESRQVAQRIAHTDLRADLEGQVAALRAELAALQSGTATELEASVTALATSLGLAEDTMRADVQALRLGLESWVAEFSDHLVWAEREVVRLQADVGAQLRGVHEELAANRTHAAEQVQAAREAIDQLAANVAQGADALALARQLAGQLGDIEHTVAAIDGRLGNVEQGAARTLQRVAGIEHEAAFTDARFAMTEDELSQAHARLDHIDAWLEHAAELALMEPRVVQVAAEPPPSREAIIVYRVREGEVLWDIAAALTGSALNYRRIMEMNGLEVPALLRAGQELRVPIHVLETEFEL